MSSFRLPYEFCSIQGAMGRKKVDYIQMYTDGSKTEHTTNSSFYVNKFAIKQVVKINEYHRVTQNLFPC